MPQAANAGNDHPIAGLAVEHFEALVYRHAGAQHRGCRGEFEGIGQFADIGRIGQHVLGVSTVHRVTCHLLAIAQSLPTGDAMLAMAAGRVQPRHADAVAFLDPGNARSHLGDIANAFMAGDERQRRLDRPVAIGGVQIGMANAGGFDLDQNPARRNLGNGHLLDDQRLAVGMNDGRFHCCCHDLLLVRVSKRRIGDVWHRQMPDRHRCCPI
ncbi:hypothetical protein SDC9_162050 [bioreactor metagenome]|uniref:Uncharacterized protein n=1 Tax=bioreactor metagenome TaxID=1076179 RepID=A0A645FRD0_9ZZZZ